MRPDFDDTPKGLCSRVLYFDDTPKGLSSRVLYFDDTPKGLHSRVLYFINVSFVVFSHFPFHTGGLSSSVVHRSTTCTRSW